MTSGATIFKKIVLLLCIGLKICQAGNHYCVNGLTSSVELDDFYHRDETIVPSIPNEPEEQRKNYKRCRWNINFKSPDISKNLQIILQTIPDSREGSDGGETARKDLNIFSQGDPTERRMEATPGLFLVYPLRKRNRFTNTIEWDPKKQSRSPVRLRYLVPLPGICNVDMLSFNDSCYAVSAYRQNATDAFSSIKGNAQLASFSSLSEIEEFVQANIARESEYPYRRPLSLSQPVTLGMFLDTDAASGSLTVSILPSNSSGCKLQPLSKPEEFVAAHNISGSCASLSLDESDKVVVKFGSCDTSMLALIKFPQSAHSYQKTENCDRGDFINKLTLVKMASRRITFMSNISAQDPRTTRKKHGSADAPLIILVLGATCLVLISAGVTTYLTRCACKKCMQVRDTGYPRNDFEMLQESDFVTLFGPEKL